MYRKYYPVRSWGAQPRISGFPSTAVLIFSIFYQQVFFMFWWLPSMPHYFYKKLENVSCEYDRLNGWNSTLQAAWYMRHVRKIWFLWTRPTIWFEKNRKAPQLWGRFFLSEVIFASSSCVCGIYMDRSRVLEVCCCGSGCLFFIVAYCCCRCLRCMVYGRSGTTGIIRCARAVWPPALHCKWEL